MRPPGGAQVMLHFAFLTNYEKFTNLHLRSSAFTNYVAS